MPKYVEYDTKSRTYAVWSGMKQRCMNPMDSDYYNYGARGISVCDRWISYENFLADMGEAPEGLTLERQDNNGIYCKDNCRWATRTEQNNNRRERSIESAPRWNKKLQISGVYWNKGKDTWQVKGKTKPSRTFSNLLDACCYRLSPN